MVGRSRRVLWALLLLSGGAAAGCKGPHGLPDLPPEVHNLQVSPGAVYVGTGGGTATLEASFGFSDTVGNVSTLVVKVLDGAGAVRSQVIRNVNLNHILSGNLNGAIEVPTDLVGPLRVQVFLVDAADQASNVVEAPVRISDVPFKARAPMPTPRDRAAAAPLDGLVYVIGGQGAGGAASAAVEAYDPVADTWSPRASMSVARVAPAIGVLGGAILVAGDPGGTVEAYDPATDGWSSRPALPTPRGSAAGFVLGGRFVVAGGEAATESGAVEAYDAGLDAWSASASLPHPRSAAASCVAGTSAYVIGGFDATASSPFLTDVSVLGPGGAWTGGPLLPVGVSQTAAVAAGTRLLIFGGLTAAGATDDVEALEPGQGGWLQMTPMPRASATLAGAVLGGKAYLFDAAGTLVYDPANELR